MKHCSCEAPCARAVPGSEHVIGVASKKLANGLRSVIENHAVRSYGAQRQDARIRGPSIGLRTVRAHCFKANAHIPSPEASLRRLNHLFLGNGTTRERVNYFITLG